MQWLFQVGACIALQAKDVEELLHLNTSNSVRNQLLHEVQLLDAINYKIRSEELDSAGDENARVGAARTSEHDDDDDEVEENGAEGELGISVYLSARLERDVHSQSGPLLQSPLLKAAMFGNTAAVKLLLAKGADPCARDANGWTVLHVSIVPRFKSSVLWFQAMRG